MRQKLDGVRSKLLQCKKDFPRSFAVNLCHSYNHLDVGCKDVIEFHAKQVDWSWTHPLPGGPPNNICGSESRSESVFEAMLLSEELKEFAIVGAFLCDVTAKVTATVPISFMLTILTTMDFYYCEIITTHFVSGRKM